MFMPTPTFEAKPPPAMFMPTLPFEAKPPPAMFMPTPTFEAKPPPALFKPTPPLRPSPVMPYSFPPRSKNMQNQPPESPELRIRSIRIIWFALIMSIGFYFVLTLFAHRSEDVEPNSMLSMILLIIAVSTTLLSFLIKSKLLTKAIDQAQAQQVQQAYV